MRQPWCSTKCPDLKVRRSGFNYLLAMCSWAKVLASFTESCLFHCKVECLIPSHSKWVEQDVPFPPAVFGVSDLRYWYLEDEPVHKCIPSFLRRMNKSSHHWCHTVWKQDLKYCEMMKFWMNVRLWQGWEEWRVIHLARMSVIARYFLHESEGVMPWRKKRSFKGC